MRKAEKLTSPGSCDKQSTSSTPEVMKRPGYSEGTDGFFYKKQRISHYTRSTVPPPSCPPTGLFHSSLSTSPPDALTPETSPKEVLPQETLSQETFPLEILPQGTYPQGTFPQGTSPDETSPKPPDYYPYFHLPKYLLAYREVKDSEQRRKYKDDFNADYIEYRRLYSILVKDSEKFFLLRDQLASNEKDSDGWIKVKEVIVTEYNVSRNTDTKERFLYLHEKLSHIKRLVEEYDEKEEPVLIE